METAGPGVSSGRSRTGRRECGCYACMLVSELMRFYRLGRPKKYSQDFGNRAKMVDASLREQAMQSALLPSVVISRFVT